MTNRIWGVFLIAVSVVSFIGYYAQDVTVPAWLGFSLGACQGTTFVIGYRFMKGDL